MRKQQQVAAAGVARNIAGPAATFHTDLSAAFASCNERLLDLQKQAIEMTFAEASAVQAAWLKAASAMFDLLPQRADRAYGAPMMEIAEAWLQAVGQTQTALIEALAGTGVADGMASSRRGQVERRKLAVVIDFPDRRHGAPARQPT